MCIDFRKARSDPTETCLHKRKNGWQVSVRRHLGVILDNKLCWNENVSCIIQKAITSFLSEKNKKIRSFGVSASLLAVFYNAAVCNALTFDVVCWGGNISKHEWGRLDKIAKKREPSCGS